MSGRRRIGFSDAHEVGRELHAHHLAEDAETGGEEAGLSLAGADVDEPVERSVPQGLAYRPPHVVRMRGHVEPGAGIGDGGAACEIQSRGALAQAVAQTVEAIPNRQELVGTRLP
jgi:hypothetical protein